MFIFVQSLNTDVGGVTGYEVELEGILGQNMKLLGIISSEVVLNYN